MLILRLWDKISNMLPEFRRAYQCTIRDTDIIPDQNITRKQDLFKILFLPDAYIN